MLERLIFTCAKCGSELSIETIEGDSGTIKILPCHPCTQSAIRVFDRLKRFVETGTDRPVWP